MLYSLFEWYLMKILRPYKRLPNYILWWWKLELHGGSVLGISWKDFHEKVNTWPKSEKIERSTTNHVWEKAKMLYYETGILLKRYHYSHHGTKYTCFLVIKYVKLMSKHQTEYCLSLDEMFRVHRWLCSLHLLIFHSGY